MQRWLWLGLVVLLGACGPAPAAPARGAAAATAAVTAAPSPSPAPPFRSAGLGASRGDWELWHRPDGGAGSYDRRAFAVRFRGERVWRLERTWGEAGAVPLDGARAAARGLLPADARLVRTSAAPASGGTVELYRSETLEARFPADSWPGGAPGQLAVAYRGASGRVPSLVI